MIEMFVVYKGASDTKYLYTVRRYEIGACKVVPKEIVLESDDYLDILLSMEATELTKINSHDSDDPVILETWI